MQYARVIGGLGSIYVGAMNFQDLKKQGYTAGRAVTRIVFGYDKTEPTDEPIIEKVMRAVEGSWWPVLTGELVHQFIGNPKGAFDTGVGMKLNSTTPKGMNF